MAEYPENYRFTKDHEWLSEEGEQIKVGISSHAQSELGEVVFVELPEVGTEFKAGDAACVVESTKAASDVYSPVAGKIVAVNESLNDDPSLVNSDPQGAGWMFMIKGINKEELLNLMTAEEYQKLVG